MTQDKIQPHLDLPKVNKFCILSGNPDRVPKIANKLINPKKIAEKRGLIAFEGKTPKEKQSVSVLTTGMGCPSTGIILEEAYRAGGRVFIRVGSCGALKSGIKIGDIIIPYAAIRDERTSLNLAPMKFPAAASPQIFQFLCESAKRLNLEYHSGIVWTTDVYYSTNPNQYKKWAKNGANSVEMESALIYVFGLVRNITTGSILIVDGNLAEGSQKTEGALGDVLNDFQKGQENAITITINAIDMLALEIGDL